MYNQIDIIINTGNETINALEATISLPGGSRINSIETGRSVLVLWVDGPAISENGREVTFSGIIPGGFRGEGIALSLTGEFTDTEIEQIKFNTVRALKNDGEGSEARVILNASSSVSEIDTIPPESFRLEITRSDELFDGKYFMIFSTQDKQSGVERYEVKENIFGEYSEARSPYVLTNQKLNNKIYVRAVDGAGNIRTESIYPPNWLNTHLPYIFTAIIVVGIFAFVCRRYMAKIFKIVFTLILLAPTIVGAATLNFSPSSNSYDVGNTFLLNVYVSSADQAINAASGVVSFPRDKLEVVSISRNGSIFSFWVQEPSFSNSLGTINFEGVITNPGYIGLNGKILTITFRIKSAGSAAVTLTSASVLANDGQGTNVLTSLGRADFTLKAADIKPTEPIAEGTEADSEIKQTEVEPPSINSFPEKLRSGQTLMIEGNTYANSKVTVFYNFGGETTSKNILSNNEGGFIFIIDRELEEGVYRFWVTVTHPSGIQSAPSEQVTVLVTPSIIRRLSNWLTGIIAVILPLVGIILLTLVLGWYIWHKLIIIRKRLKKEVSEADSVLHKAFNLLREDMNEQIKMLDRAGAKRDLTNEEKEIIKRHKENLTEAERVIEKEIKDVSAELR